MRIPTLAAVIELAEARSGGAIRYNIETKLSESAPDQTPPPEEFAEAVLAVVQQAGVTERVVIQSFDWRTLRHLASIAPDVQTSCLTFGSGDLDEMAEAGCSIWSPRFQSLDEMEVEAAHGAGMTVAVWTVNEPQEIEAALSLGVDAIISDYPDRVRTALEASSLSLPPAFPPAM